MDNVTEGSILISDWMRQRTETTRKQRLLCDNGREMPGGDEAANVARQGKAVPTLHYRTIDGKEGFRHAIPWHSGPSPEVKKAGLNSEWCVVCGKTCPRLKDHEASSGQ